MTGDSLCDKVDGAVQLANGKMFVFSDQYYWEISEKLGVLSAPKFIQNYWGISIEIPLDAIFTFNTGRFANKTIFIKEKKWWRVTADGDLEASNTIDWKEWPNAQLDAAFVLNLRSFSSDNSLVCFLFGSKYSIYEFGSHEKAMLTPIPVISFQNACVTKDNELSFITNSITCDTSISDLIKVTASLSTLDGKFIFLFGEHNKYCKVATSHMICNIKLISDLLKCDRKTIKPEAGEETFFDSGTQGTYYSVLNKFQFFRLSLFEWILMILHLKLLLISYESY